MMEFVPVALSCGHLIEGIAHFDTGPPPRVECQQGCGWQTFVIEPNESCAAMPTPGTRCDVCGVEHRILEIDLGDIEGGDMLIVELLDIADDVE